MEVLSKRRIEPGPQYDHLFPEPRGNTVFIRRGAGVGDTLGLMQQTALSSLDQTKRIANVLTGETTETTLSNLWDFCVKHFRYRRDREGIEEVRTPARSWRDRRTGIDCDCFTVFIVSVLLNIRKLRPDLIPFPPLMRVAAYGGRTNFSHVYPILPRRDGSYFTIDPIVDFFDYEEPFTKHKDYPMDLHLLNGPGCDCSGDGWENPPPLQNGLSGPRKIKRRETLHKINRPNPATVLLRSGLLAAAKLGVPRKLIGNLLRTYLKKSEATRKGVPGKVYDDIRAIRCNLETIFYNAGGLPQNLRNALLTGKANRGNLVSRTGAEPLCGPMNEFSESDSLREILGSAIYHSEISQPLVSGGLSGTLGEVATGAAMTAAMGTLTTLAATVNKIGDMTGKISDTVSTATNAVNTTTTAIDKIKNTFNPGTSQPPNTTPAPPSQGKLDRMRGRLEQIRKNTGTIPPNIAEHVRNQVKAGTMPPDFLQYLPPKTTAPAAVIRPDQIQEKPPETLPIDSPSQVNKTYYGDSTGDNQESNQGNGNKGNWLKRNWPFVALGTVIVGGGIGAVVHSKRKKKKEAEEAEELNGKPPRKSAKKPRQPSKPPARTKQQNRLAKVAGIAPRTNNNDKAEM